MFLTPRKCFLKRKHEKHGRTKTNTTHHQNQLFFESSQRKSSHLWSGIDTKCDNLQAEMLPIIRWACRPKKDEKTTQTEPWDPEPMGKGFEERIIACHKKPWLNHHLSHLHTPFCHIYVLSKLVLFCSLWLILFIVLSSHSNSNSCQTGEMFRWKVCRQSQKIHRKSTPPWLPQTVATWPCSQWQREKNTLCVKNTVFFHLWFM